MFKKENTALIVIDIQDKLANVMHEKKLLFQNAKKLVQGIRALEIPVIWLEQNPRALGPTIPEVADVLLDIKPINKMSFSCCGNEQFMQALQATNRKQILITGIEAHVCVYQTAADLLDCNVGESGVLALGATNALYFDAP